MAAAAAAAAHPHALSAFVARMGWLGNRRLFSNPVAMKLEETVPGFKLFNDVTYVAPFGKWSLSVVPLYQIFQGLPTVDRLDMTQSSSLAATGLVWSYYALLITPQNFGSFLLCACNFAMGSVNGYNVWRRYKYDSENAAKQNATVKV